MRKKMQKTLKDDVKTQKKIKNPMPTPYSVNSHITECTNSNSVDIIKYGKICKKCLNIKVTNFITIFGIILVTHTCKTITRMPQIICKIPSIFISLLGKGF